MNMEPNPLLAQPHGPMRYTNLHANITQGRRSCWDCRWLWGPADPLGGHAVCGADHYRMVMLAEGGCSRWRLGGDDERCREG